MSLTAFCFRKREIRGVVQLEAASESLESVIFAMQSAGILVPPTVDERGESRDEPNQLLWQITHGMIEKFMPGFMGSIVPSPPQAPSPVRVVRSTRSSTFPAIAAEWQNLTPFWHKRAPVEKVTRNAAALNGTSRYHRLHDPLLSNCYCLHFFAAVSVLLSYLLFYNEAPRPVEQTRSLQQRGRFPDQTQLIHVSTF